MKGVYETKRKKWMKYEEKCLPFCFVDVFECEICFYAFPLYSKCTWTYFYEKTS